MINQLELRAESLASKWGFADGDIVTDYLYSLEDLGYKFIFPKINFTFRDEFLGFLIDKCLVPKLKEKGLRFEVTKVGTIHNPFRIYELNGNKLNHYDLCDVPELQSISISLSPEDVLNMLQIFNKELEGENV
jgi:hypothetical protein